MEVFTGKEVNHVLRTVKSMVPGTDAKSGELQLSILAVALCAAARQCGVTRENFLGHLALVFDDAQTRELVPLTDLDDAGE